MPELPEVETIRRDLAVEITNQPISALKIFSPKTAKNSAAFFKKSLLGASFSRLGRRGKLLIFSINQPKLISPRQTRSVHKTNPALFLLIHLKMTGQLIYVNHQKKIAGGHSLDAKAAKGTASFSKTVGGDLPNRQTRVMLEFKNGGQLFFNDLRRFGYLKIVSAQELEKIISTNYGPEPLTVDFSLNNFRLALAERKLKIKALLLNQKIIAGLGNIYVDESLFAARINPERLAKSLTPLEIKKLWQVIGQIIKKAVFQRGTTFSNYVDSRGRSGNFSRFLKVYGRGGEACPTCGAPLKKKKVAGRGTHYCAYCQK